MELSCVAQTYDWGKIGNSSLVAQLLRSNKNFKLEENLPYAELWMGTHQNGESNILSTGETLHNFLQRNPISMGTAGAVAQGDLPFLFKVLSVRRSLSIQAHPDKDLAVLLNQRQPTQYRDARHKPEIAVAISEFEVLAGFRPVEEIKHFLKMVPEYASLIDQNSLLNFMKGHPGTTLKSVFYSLMTADSSEVKQSLTLLMTRLKGTIHRVREEHLIDLLEVLMEQHPGDVGIFTIYMFNYIKLQPGEAIFIAAGIPHCYLKGDCVECMACSDNVVRAGLTSKFRDLGTLSNMLNYASFTPDEMKFKGKHIDSKTIVFKPPVKEFAVVRVCIPPSEHYVIPAHHGCSLFIIIEGTGSSKDFDVRPGVVLFIPAHTELEMLVETQMLTFQALCNI